MSMHLREKVNGVWHIVHRTKIDGKWASKSKSTGSTDKVMAEALLAEAKKNVELLGSAKNKEAIKQRINETAKHFAGMQTSSYITFEMAWDEFLKDEATMEMKPRALSSCKSGWKTFSEYCESRGYEFIEDVDSALCRDYMAQLKADGKADATRKNRMRYASGVFNRIAGVLGLHANPWTFVNAPKRIKQKHRRAYSIEELERIFDVVKDNIRWETLCVMSLYTGMRLGNCCHYSLDTLEIQSELKNERYNSKVITPMHPRLELQINKVRRGRVDGVLLPAEAELYDRNPATLSRQFKKILIEAKVEKETKDGFIDFHAFRHTFNTMLVESGTQGNIIRQTTGHSSDELTQRYTHAQISVCKEAVIMALPNNL